MRKAAIFAACLGAIAVVAAPASATFPGENGRIAVEMGPQMTRIATVNPDGTDLTVLTAGNDFLPAWSPDGERLGFIHFNTSMGTLELWVMKADGSDPQKLADDVDAQVSAVAWSPDGAHIALEGPSAHGLQVYDLAGGSFLLSPPGGPDVMENPDWSPDGDRILVSGYFGSDPYDLYAVKADGSRISRITFTGLGPYGPPLPSWSPDGSRIVVRRNLGISVLAADGRDLGQLVDVGQHPVWSPDGTKIAFAGAGEQDRGDVVIVNLDGSGRTTLLDGQPFQAPAFDNPDWQPIPNHAPDCSGVTAAPNVLWPPNKKFRKVPLSGASDPDGDTVTLEVTGVTHDERAGRRPDFRLNGDSTVLLRAKRHRKGDGRVYTVAFSVTDEHGANCTGTTTVSVPRHRRGNSPRYDD